MPIVADNEAIAPTCHVFNFPPQNHPDGNVLTACVKSSDSRATEIISILCLANNAISAPLETESKHKSSIVILVETYHSAYIPGSWIIGSINALFVLFD